MPILTEGLQTFPKVYSIFILMEMERYTAATRISLNQLKIQIFDRWSTYSCMSPATLLSLPWPLEESQCQVTGAISETCA